MPSSFNMHLPASTVMCHIKEKALQKWHKLVQLKSSHVPLWKWPEKGCQAEGCICVALLHRPGRQCAPSSHSAMFARECATVPISAHAALTWPRDRNIWTPMRSSPFRRVVGRLVVSMVNHDSYLLHSE